MSVDVQKSNQPPSTQHNIDLSGECETGRINFLLRPRAVMYTMVQDTTENPQKHDDFIVINLGKAEITAEIEYGTRKEKLGVLNKAVLKPGDELALSAGDDKFEVTTLKVTNETKVKAAFQVEGGRTILPTSVGEHYSELLDKDDEDLPCEFIPMDGLTRTVEIPSTNDISANVQKLSINEINDHGEEAK